MLINSVETFLHRHEMAPTVFGRLAVQDPRLVLDLRKGREPRMPMDQRVRGFMDGYDLGRESRDVG